MNPESGTRITKPAPVQSVARALELLEAVVAAGEMSLGELAVETRLSRSTTHRLLSALTAAGYVAGAPGGRYRVGSRLGSLATAVLDSSHRVAALARPHLLEIRDRFDETVNLVELNGWNARYADQVESSRPVRMFNQVGNEVPLHTSAAGKAMLAAQEERVREAFLSRAPFERMTANTITAARAMRDEIEAIERRGYAFDLEERDEGVVCVAAAIGTSAAISISGPAERMNRLDLDAVGTALASAATEVSAALVTARSA